MSAILHPSHVRAAILSRGRSIDDCEVSMEAMRYAVSREFDSGGTASQQWGTLVHAYILERDRLAMSDFDSRRGNGWTEFESACKSAGKIALTVGEAHRLEDVGDAVFSHPDAKRIVETTRHEQAFCDPARSTVCRVDMVSATLIADLKTMQSVDERSIRASMWRYGVDVQLGMYRDMVGRHIQRLVVIAVQSKPPHLVRLVEVSLADAEAAARLGWEIVRRYRTCEIVDSFRDDVQTIQWTPPEWATDERDISTGEIDASEL